MYYELERLLSRGEKVVIDGIRGTGKSYLASQFCRRYNLYRNADWYSTMHIADEGFFDRYQIFDRCPWIDRYVYLYNTKDALSLCVEGFVENLPNSHILLLLDDRWVEKREGESQSIELRDNQVTRFIEIVREIYETGKIKSVMVTTPRSFRNIQYWKGGSFWELCEEESLKGEHDEKGRLQSPRAVPTSNRHCQSLLQW